MPRAKPSMGRKLLTSTKTKPANYNVYDYNVGSSVPFLMYDWSLESYRPEDLKFSLQMPLTIFANVSRFFFDFLKNTLSDVMRRHFAPHSHTSVKHFGSVDTMLEKVVTIFTPIR